VRQHPTLPAILCWAALLTLSATAQAEVVCAESIEWVVADSDLVLIGVVSKVEKVPGKERPYEAATVKVRHTVKGRPADQVTFLLRNYNGPAAEDWLADGVPLLFCLVRRAHARDSGELPAGHDWVLRDDGNQHSAVLLGKPRRHWAHTIHAFTREFDVLTEPAAIIKQAKEAARPLPEGRQKKPHTLSVPGGTPACRKLYAGSAVSLIVPVDGELERVARLWCCSASFYTRLNGVRALRHFRNESNIAILKSLLSDPGCYFTTKADSKGGERRVRVFRARQLAYETLREFGVKVEPPVVDEPDE
jgi:hypothetical protein